MAWYASTFPALPDDVACLKTSPGFVDSYAEMLGPLCAGIPLVIAPDDSATDPVALSALLGRYNVTRLVLVPTLLRAVLAHGDMPRLQSLRLCACSGEPLDTSLAQAFLKAVPGCRLINIYGSSEVTADATWADITPPLGARTDIGKPLPGVAVAVVDAAGHAVPDGFPGELAISGIGLADSYLDDPALTARRFQPLPAFGGQRAFLSGDLAMQSPGGPLLLLGRRDRQLKLEGVRIDAAEIESALAAQPGILCSRVVLDNSTVPPRLIAAVVARTPPDESALRRHLHTHLPRAAIPHQWVWMDALPVGATGKTDDAALLAIARQAPAPAHNAVQSREPLRTDTERLLAQQWSDILGCRITGRDAHFLIWAVHR
ncbi:AMP-binding protein [Neopusillimonas aromaticivorans]|nr:AMP-binding protein [Neopusillimonas aromaticivorans]WJJ95037.1 AMP-binding protein [Neopusillimonas aromaticivorans]